jgi:ribosomal protein S12 methylthiotransferase
LSVTYQKPPVEKNFKGTYAFISLGCPKNTVDSERMMGLLRLDGYQLVSDPVDSDFVVVNTCGFIEAARKESYSAIDEMLELKRAGKTRGVIVSGCLAERQKEQMLTERPDIDSLVGVFSREEITNIVDRMLGDQEEQRSLFQPAPIRALPDDNRLRITPKHFAYLKISEGCDRLCTFCAIPKMRGKHATKPMERVIAEAQQLADSGVRELVIVAQDTTYYGIDMYGEPRLTELLLELDQVEGLEWIRLMYLYPMYIDQRLIETIANARRIVPYIDMPLQHINDNMLRRMSRRVNRRQTEQIIGDLRSGIKNLTLRTTMITGFPGETEEQYLELCEFVKQQRFERLGVFTYSFEPDTPSAKLPDPVDAETMQRRQTGLMQIQQQVIFERNESLIGSTLRCVIDQAVPDHAGAWVARSAADAPDVDGLVFVTQMDEQLKAGHLVDCEIVATQGYDLVAVATGTPF